MAAPLTILPDPPAVPGPVGLIAGGGRLPLVVAEGLKAMGYTVHGLGLGDQQDPQLPGLCDTFEPVGVLRLGSWGRKLRSKETRHAIMVGRVDKAKMMFDPFRAIRYLPDATTALAWYRHLRHDRRSHVLLGVVAQELEVFGVQLLDSTMPITDQLATAGVMTRLQPTSEQRAEVDFAWPLLTELLRLDIGQAIAVRQRDVIAVEGVEGTDRLIERTGPLCRGGGWLLCKGARVGHDRRSDVPTVGTQTLINLHKHGGRVLALAAGDVIMVDKPTMLLEAERLGICIIGVPAALVR